MFFIFYFFFLMIRRPPRSTLDRSSAASDVYKRQIQGGALVNSTPEPAFPILQHDGLLRGYAWAIVLLSALLLQPVLVSRAAASWSGGPNANLQIEAMPNAQDTPAAIPDGAGGAIIVWEDFR